MCLNLAAILYPSMSRVCRKNVLSVVKCISRLSYFLTPNLILYDMLRQWPLYL